VIFLLYYVYVLNYICCFAFAEPPLHYWNETNLIMVYGIFNVWWTHVLLKILPLCSSKKLVWLCYKGNTMFIEWEVVFLFFLFCGIIWRSLVLVLSFFFLWYLGLNSGPTPWVTPSALFCDGYFWVRVSWTICHKFEPQSSWSWPPE
jgi:hypothetical protein